MALEETLDLDELLRLAEMTEPINYEEPKFPVLEHSVKIAVAADDAFCFTYLDNLSLLEKMGAKLVFSPLKDTELPKGISGMILSGGYPELHGKELAANRSMRQSVKKAIKQGMPCIAECGGFLYLHRELEDQDGIFYPMAGVLDAKAYRTNKLGRFGYINLTANEAQLLGDKGMSIRGHEFHYWESEQCGESFHAKKPVGKRQWTVSMEMRHCMQDFHICFSGLHRNLPIHFEEMRGVRNMLILVTGGSGSGKSAFAESVVMGLKTRPNLYIATMYPFDEECHRRIARHRLMRRDKGFETLECYTGLKDAKIPSSGTTLLECMSNPDRQMRCIRKMVPGMHACRRS